MTDIQQVTAFYLGLGINTVTDSGYFLPPGKFKPEDMVPVDYVYFFSADGNKVIHYFTHEGCYWTTYTGHIQPK